MRILSYYVIQNICSFVKREKLKPYTRELIQEPEGGWLVQIKELSGCMSQGDTAEEALARIEDAMRGWLATSLEGVEPISEPRCETGFSGKFMVI
jgi:antitoxin HicB